MGRLTFQMDMQESVAAMSDGNPGAIAAMCALVKEDYLLGCVALVDLDRARIYGEDIYLLWSNGCERDAARMLTVIQDGKAVGAVAAYRIFLALQMLSWSMEG